MNQVTLIGRIGNELVYENNHLKVSVATTERYKNKAGEIVVDTDWHNVVLFGSSAENFAKFFKKGDGVVVTGKIKYTKKDDKYYTSIICNGWEFLPSNNVNKESQSTQPQQQPSIQDTINNAHSELEEDDSLPF